MDEQELRRLSEQMDKFDQTRKSRRNQVLFIVKKYWPFICKEREAGRSLRQIFEFIKSSDTGMIGTYTRFTQVVKGLDEEKYPSRLQDEKSGKADDNSNSVNGNSKPAVSGERNAAKKEVISSVRDALSPEQIKKIMEDASKISEKR